MKDVNENLSREVLLEGVCATVFQLCLLEGNFFGWRTADKQELILSAHWLDLLGSNHEYNNAPKYMYYQYPGLRE